MAVTYFVIVTFLGFVITWNLSPQQLLKVKQSRYRPGLAQRVPGS